MCGALLQNPPQLVESARHVEATLPFAALERQQHLAAAVQIAEPFGILRVLEVRPHVLIELLEPGQTLAVARELVALEHGDGRFEVHPPQLLVPFELLLGMPQTVHEVEAAAVLFVPAVFDRPQGDFDGAVDQIAPAEPYAHVHDEPHGFERVARIDRATLE